MCLDINQLRFNEYFPIFPEILLYFVEIASALNFSNYFTVIEIL